MAETTFQKSTLREYFESIVVAVILALFVRTFVFQAFKIPTGSMKPNLLVGDHLLVNKFIFAPTAAAFERALLPMRPIERGDILVFKFPEEPERDFIKRTIGLPGDTIEISDKVLFVNGFTTHFTNFHTPERVRFGQDYNPGGADLLRYLITQAHVPEYQVRWRWTPNSVAIWDNRSTQHYAVMDYPPCHRRMDRATVIGDRPF